MPDSLTGAAAIPPAMIGPSSAALFWARSRRPSHARSIPKRSVIFRVVGEGEPPFTRTAVEVHRRGSNNRAPDRHDQSTSGSINRLARGAAVDLDRAGSGVE